MNLKKSKKMNTTKEYSSLIDYIKVEQAIVMSGIQALDLGNTENFETFLWFQSDAYGLYLDLLE